MTRQSLPRLGSAAILNAGGLATFAICSFAFNPLFVTGGTALALISGPPVGAWMVAVGAALLLGGAAWAPGCTRWLLLLAWAIFLATATHRLVERADGAVLDQWLGIPLQRLAASADERRRCRVVTFSAHCEDEAGRGFSTVSPFPVVPFSRGAGPTLIDRSAELGERGHLDSVSQVLVLPFVPLVSAPTLVGIFTLSYSLLRSIFPNGDAEQSHSR